MSTVILAREACHKPLLRTSYIRQQQARQDKPGINCHCGHNMRKQVSHLRVIHHSRADSSQLRIVHVWHPDDLDIEDAVTEITISVTMRKQRV